MLPVRTAEAAGGSLEGGGAVTLIEHIESFLGGIDAGWSEGVDGQKMDFQVVRCPMGVSVDTVAFLTLGLSCHRLTSRVSGKVIHHELLMVVSGHLHTGYVPGLLQQVAAEQLLAGEALVRGQVLAPRGALVEGSELEAIYVGVPVCLPDEFGTYRGTNEDVIFAWLIPISKSEAQYVDAYGWVGFEDRLVEANPDLTDMFRRPLQI